MPVDGFSSYPEFSIRLTFLESFTSHLAAYGGNTAFKITDTCLPCIALDNFLNTSLIKSYVILFKTIFLKLFWYKKQLSNFKLILFCISIKFDDLHPVLQCWRNRMQTVGRSYEKDIG